MRRRNDSSLLQNNRENERKFSSPSPSSSSSLPRERERSQRKEKLQPSDVPKLSFTFLENDTKYVPRLHKRDIDENEKGYVKRERERDRERDRDTREINQGIAGDRTGNKFGSGKYPPIGKAAEYFSESYNDDVNYIARGREQREMRKVEGKLPPRDLKPISHVPVDKNNSYEQALNLVPGNKSRLPALSRSQGPGSLQPLNPMLKSSSLSKIERDIPVPLSNSHSQVNLDVNPSGNRRLAPIAQQNTNRNHQLTKLW